MRPARRALVCRVMPCAVASAEGSSWETRRDPRDLGTLRLRPSPRLRNCSSPLLRCRAGTGRLRARSNWLSAAPHRPEGAVVVVPAVGHLAAEGLVQLARDPVRELLRRRVDLETTFALLHGHDAPLRLGEAGAGRHVVDARANPRLLIVVEGAICFDQTVEHAGLDLLARRAQTGCGAAYSLDRRSFGPAPDLVRVDGVTVRADRGIGGRAELVDDGGRMSLSGRARGVSGPRPARRAIEARGRRFHGSSSSRAAREGVSAPR